VKTFRRESVTVEREIETGYQCDGCGATGLRGYDVIRVVIEVHEGEEGGGRDEYDYCDDCLVARAPLLAAAGSRAPLVAPAVSE
jgi:hypothetical protein